MIRSTMNHATTDRLEGLWTRHSERIETLIERFALPLHLFFVEEMAAQADGFFGVRDVPIIPKKQVQALVRMVVTNATDALERAL